MGMVTRVKAGFEKFVQSDIGIQVFRNVYEPIFNEIRWNGPSAIYAHYFVCHRL